MLQRAVVFTVVRRTLLVKCAQKSRIDSGEAAIVVSRELSCLDETRERN